MAGGTAPRTSALGNNSRRDCPPAGFVGGERGPSRTGPEGFVGLGMGTGSASLRAVPSPFPGLLRPGTRCGADPRPGNGTGTLAALWSQSPFPAALTVATPGLRRPGMGTGSASFAAPVPLPRPGEDGPARPGRQAPSRAVPLPMLRLRAGEWDWLRGLRCLSPFPGLSALGTRCGADPRSALGTRCGADPRSALGTGTGTCAALRSQSPFPGSAQRMAPSAVVVLSPGGSGFDISASRSTSAAGRVSALRTFRIWSRAWPFSSSVFEATQSAGTTSVEVAHVGVVGREQDADVRRRSRSRISVFDLEVVEQDVERGREEARVLRLEDEVVVLLGPEQLGERPARARRRPGSARPARGSPTASGRSCR